MRTAGSTSAPSSPVGSPERCTVLAEEAVMLDAADRATTEARIKAAQDELADADNDDERAAAQAELDIAEALLSAITAAPTN